jgi:hypothetical protein
MVKIPNKYRKFRKQLEEDRTIYISNFFLPISFPFFVAVSVSV